MRRSLVVALLPIFLSTGRPPCGPPAGPAPCPRRPVATFSIVARDEASGEIGVAVQSHWFSVGPIVPWAEAGVGAVATQSLVDPSYGPLGLDLMRAGKSAPQALAGLVAADEGREVRQVAMIDGSGRVAAHTGKKCIAEAGQKVGESYSVQANLMEHPTVWGAMAKAFEGAKGDLADRMLVALAAAQAEGGDVRGMQSAAILVVAAKRTGRPWEDRLLDLRVEDHPDPISELRRLVQLARAYRKLNEGDEHFGEGEIEKAMAAYAEATTLVSDDATGGEAPFWVGVTLARAGRVKEAIPYLARAQRQADRWATVVARLPASGLLPDDAALVAKLVAGMREAR